MRPPAQPDPAKGARLGFLDWTRGLAIAIILQGHVFDSFTRKDLRNDGPFVLSQFLGGLAPAVFLVLTGITLSFLMDRRQREELPASKRWQAALRRGRYLFLLAFVFRIQLWAFAFGQSPWTDLFKVDVLNCMGLAICLMSVMAIFTTAERVRMCAALGLVIALAAPVVSALDWKGLPWQLSNYLVPNYNFFAFFPWAAFIAFGISVGSVLRLTKPEEMGRVMQWGAMLGFGLVIGGQYFANLPYSVYPKSEFWLNSPLLILIKFGLVLLVLATAYVWNEYAVGTRWSWLRQFGTTSLLIYWVHIELVYGRWFPGWKENLSTPQVVSVAAGLMVLMLGLSLFRARWNKIDWSAQMASFFPTAPGRASGD